MSNFYYEVTCYYVATLFYYFLKIGYDPAKIANMNPILTLPYKYPMKIDDVIIKKYSQKGYELGSSGSLLKPTPL